MVLIIENIEFLLILTMMAQNVLKVEHCALFKHHQYFLRYAMRMRCYEDQVIPIRYDCRIEEDYVLVVGDRKEEFMTKLKLQLANR